MLTVIILCGGKGTRIRSVLASLPKVLAPIGNKAFIDYMISWISSGLKSIPYRIVLATCVGHNSIENYVKSNSIDCFLSRENFPLGTLGAVIDVVDKNNIKKDVLVLNGDTLFNFDFLDAYEVFSKNNNRPLLVVKPSATNGRYGGYQRDKTGKVRFCSHNPEYISLGAFFCKGSELLRFKDQTPSDPCKGKMLDQDFLDHSNIATYILSCDIDFIDIGVPDDYDLAQYLIPKIISA